MNEETHMLYDPQTNTMLAIGGKVEIEKVAKSFMDAMQMFNSMRNPFDLPSAGLTHIRKQNRD